MVIIGKENYKRFYPRLFLFFSATFRLGLFLTLKTKAIIHLSIMKFDCKSLSYKFWILSPCSLCAILMFHRLPNTNRFVWSDDFYQKLWNFLCVYWSLIFHILSQQSVSHMKIPVIWISFLIKLAERKTLLHQKV